MKLVTNQPRYLIFFLTINSLYCLYLLYFFSVNKYLPAPFIYDKNNTFMDFYNVLYWSRNDGIYTIWDSVYPPLNFLLLHVYQLFFIDDISWYQNAFEIRNFYGVEITSLIIFWVICIYQSVMISFKEILGLKEKLQVFLIVILSPLFLFSVERGNILILCIPLMSFYISSKNILIKSFTLALLVNIKPYFILFYIIEIITINNINRNKLFLLLMPIIAILIFLITGLILTQEFYYLPSNLIGFGANKSVVGPYDLLAFPSSVYSWSKIPEILGLVFENSFLKIPVIIELIACSLLLLKMVVVKINEDYLKIGVILIMLNFPFHFGGYLSLIILTIIPILYKNKERLMILFFILTSFSGIFDFIPIFQMNEVSMHVYLSNSEVAFQPTLTFSVIMRPLINLILLIIFYFKLNDIYE